MSVCYVQGGYTGGITRILDHDCKVVYDSTATGTKTKKPGWSANPGTAVVDRFTGLNETAPTNNLGLKTR